MAGSRSSRFFVFVLIGVFCALVLLQAPPVCADAPSIIQCYPTTGTRGAASVNVEFLGSGTSFVDGVSTATFSGAGITVNSTTVLKAYQAVANITIAADAPAGYRDVNVITGAETPIALGDGFRVKYGTPVITGIAPEAGVPGDVITVTGNEFGDTRGTTEVVFGSTAAKEYVAWGNNTIQVKVPDVSPAKTWVTVMPYDRPMSNSVDFTIELKANSSWYFAEGYVGAGFQEYLCIGNPNATAANVEVIFMLKSGSMNAGTYTIPPTSRFTINVNSQIPLEDPNAGKEVSAKIVSEAYGIVAERAMYFNYQNSWAGGHDTVGAVAPARDFYFAEGYTAHGFDEYVCILNPNYTAATVNLHFQTQEEGEKTVGGISIDPTSRASFRVNDLLGGSYQTALHVESDTPIVAERPMYFDYTGRGNWHWRGGHVAMGATSLSNEYYLAEGTTRQGFEQWLTLQNPSPTTVDITAVYQLGPGQGTPITQVYTVPGGSRSTVFVADVVGGEKDVSVKLTAPAPFLAERPLYFDYAGDNGQRWRGGDCVLGSQQTAKEWFFAEGYTGENFHEWLCIQNPYGQDVLLDVIYYTQETGQLPAKPVHVPANTRVTLRVNDHAGAGYQLATKLLVTSGPGVVVERPMYFNYGGRWDGGHCVMGYVVPKE